MFSLENPQLVNDEAILVVFVFQYKQLIDSSAVTDVVWAIAILEYGNNDAYAST